jgi:steroid delta-isomerase-like uncharacterized protein
LTSFFRVSNLGRMTFIADRAIDDVGGVLELARRWEEAWNAHDADGVAALCAEELVYDEPALGGTARGRESIRELVRSLARAFPDHVFSVVGVYADVQRRSVFVAGCLRGTHARTGRLVEFHGDDRLDVGEDGLIAEHRCLYDSDLVQKQVRGEEAAAAA